MVHIGAHYFRAISKWRYQLFDFVLYTLVKGTVIAGANASRWIQVSLYRHVIPDVDIGICSVFIFGPDIYLKLEKWQLLLSLFMGLWLPVFITLILILPIIYYSIDFCNDTYARVYWEISIKIYCYCRF
jgi:cell division protein FtsW